MNLKDVWKVKSVSFDDLLEIGKRKEGLIDMIDCALEGQLLCH